MSRHRGPVLVDTNVIIECWRVSAWKALTGGYAVETVGTCFVETQTGGQRRRPETRIDNEELAASLSKVHAVGDRELASALVRDEHLRFLDPGEQALWAHAIARADGWVLCGPDRASLRAGIRLGFKDRLVSLERLLIDMGHRPKIELRSAYTQRWLTQVLAELAQLEGR